MVTMAAEGMMVNTIPVSKGIEIAQRMIELYPGWRTTAYTPVDITVWPLSVWIREDDSKYLFSSKDLVLTMIERRYGTNPMKK